MEAVDLIGVVDMYRLHRKSRSEETFIDRTLNTLKNPSDFEEYHKQVEGVLKNYIEQLDKIHEELTEVFEQEHNYDTSKGLTAIEIAFALNALERRERLECPLDNIFYSRYVKERWAENTAKEIRENIPQEFKDRYEEFRTSYLENLKEFRKDFLTYYSKS